jgi:hypothetical protein
MTAYQAFTAYDVPIVCGSFIDRRSALSWAEREGERWPGARIIQRTASGVRTIWRAPTTTTETVFEQAIPQGQAA